MAPLLQGLGQIAAFLFSTPANTYVTCRLLMGAKRGYDSLSPQSKAKVDSIMIEAAGYLVRSTVGEVLGWTRSQAEAMGLSSEAAKVAEMGVRRIAEVGIAKAQAEMRS